MLRTSSYTVYIDLPEDEESMLIMHGYTGAYDRVSRRVGEFLLAREAHPPADPLHGRWESEPAAQSTNGRGHALWQPTDSTVAALKRRGYLTELTPEQEEGLLARIVKRIHGVRRAAAGNYLFMPTYQCNLRCSYCFQDHIRTDPEFSHLLRTMTPATVDRIFGAIEQIESRADAQGTDVSRRIGFYGGEPFLEANRPIVQYIMERGKEIGTDSFWAVSNGTQLDLYEDLLGPDGIDTIQITLDGPPAEHDKRRIHADGGGSYEQIAANIERCLEWGVRIAIRVNVDRTNIHALPGLARDVKARGWGGHGHFIVYTAPIVPTPGIGREETFSSWDLDCALDQLRAEYPEMVLISRPDDGLEARVRKLFDGESTAMESMKSSFCSAHTDMFIFDPFGDIYTCWELTGDSRVRIGRVDDEGVLQLNGLATLKWRSRTPASNPTCRKCRYALHCGGGCAVLAEGQKGKFFTNYCDAFGDRFRHSVAQAYSDHVAGAPRRAEILAGCD